jgi:hypothetical protein
MKTHKILSFSTCFVAYNDHFSVLDLQGPPQVPYYSSTNHLGRQRPPPQTAKGASSAERKGSPYTSPYRARNGAFSSERSLAGNSTIGGSSTMAGDADGAASVATMPTFIQQALEQQQRGERSYAEFQQWLTTNREWTRRREFKVRLHMFRF